MGNMLKLLTGLATSVISGITIYSIVMLINHIKKRDKKGEKRTRIRERKEKLRHGFR